MKRIYSLLLTVAILVSLCAGLAPPAQATALTTVQIQQKIDNYYNIVTNNGSKTAYWNKQQNATTLMAYADQGAYENSVSYSACTTNCALAEAARHSSANGRTTCQSNNFNGNKQCHGFGIYMGYVVFGSAAGYGGWKKYNCGGTYPGLQPGDVVRIPGHTLMIYSVSANGTVATIDCNHFGGNNPAGACQISRQTLNLQNWSASQFESKFKSSNGVQYIWRYTGASSSSSPTYSVKTTSAEKVSDSSYTLHGTAVSSGVPIKGVGMYIGTSKDNMTKLGSDTGSSYSVKMFYNTEKYGYDLKPGTTYYYCAYADINGKEVPADHIGSFTTDGKKETGEITLDSGSVTMEEGMTVRMFATTKPAGQAVSWRSSDPSVASVDSSGRISGLKAGRATVTAAMTYNGETYTATCGVTVTAASTGDISWSIDQKHYSIGTTNATVGVTGTASGFSTSEIDKVSFYLYDAAGNQLTEASASVNFSGKSASFSLWYDIENELGYTLTAGTKYQFQYSAVVGGQVFSSAMYLFTTSAPQPTETPAPTPNPVSISWSIDRNHYSIGSTNATIGVTGTVSGISTSEIDKVGFYLYDADGKLLTETSASVSFSGKTNYFNLWYNINKELGYTLNKGTTYKFKFYAVIDGATYAHSMISFTTSK